MSDQTCAQLAVLASAEGAVELGPVGVAAVITDACRAYRALAHDRDAVARLEPELVAMTRDGSPAAVISAALLLRGAGRDVTPLLAPHADDRRPCIVFPNRATGRCQRDSAAVMRTLAPRPSPRVTVVPGGTMDSSW